MNAGFGTTYVQEGYDAFMKVIKFRKEKLGKDNVLSVGFVLLIP